jgi:EmrB/QacA subfamily drug resistance transporter
MASTHRPLTVVGVMLAMFVAAMEATVVSTAMPTVVEKLGGIELYGWVSAAYMLTATVTMPLYGKLADLYGRKPVMLSGMALFVAGSMLSGLSQTMVQLIAFRAVQGVGAGGLQPVAMTIIGDVFRPAERARMQGLFGAVWGVAAMSGPLLGGLIVRALSWRWVFYINVPAAVVSAALLVTFFHEPVKKKDHALDVAGTMALASAVVAILLGASRVAPALTLPLGAMLLVGFVLVERRAREPVLSVALLARRIMAVSSVAGALVGSVMSSTLVYLPLYVQAVMGGTPTEAGATVAPMLIGWPIASTLSGRLLPRTGYRPLVRVGFSVVCGTSVMIALLLRARASTTALGATMFAMGAGMGLANTALLIAVQESASWEERGVATASTMFFRTIGGAIAVGALGAVLVAGVGEHVPASLLNELLGPEHGKGLDPAVLAQLADDLRGGLRHVFEVIAAMSVGAVGAGFLFPQRRLAQGETTPTPQLASE